jgi:FkbM family methyltransferase
MNFSGIASGTLAGRLLRLPLRFLPPAAKVRVLQGPAKGFRWIVGSSNHGCWLGSYEYKKQLRMKEAIADGAVFYDVGAHVGFYSLLASRLVGPSGSVYAFEPLPQNLSYLYKHVRENGLQFVHVVESAISREIGVASFSAGRSSSTGRLTSHGTYQVRTISLDEFVRRDLGPPPTILKIDVEGEEADVLRGGHNILERYQPIIFLATHGIGVRDECFAILSSHGYDITDVDGSGSEFMAATAA